MDTIKALSNEVLDNLLDRMHTALDNSGQFERLKRERDRIRILSKEYSRVYVDISLQHTYSHKGTSARATGLRIKFESSLIFRQLKTYTIPKWSQSKETWLFSRSKLLVKAADAIESIGRWQKENDKEMQRRKVFARFITKELGYLTERGEIKLVHDYNKLGGSIRKIVRIELPSIHIDLYSADNGQTFRIESIKPMEGKYTDKYFDIEAIKETIAKLAEIFTSEEELVLTQ